MSYSDFGWSNKAPWALLHVFGVPPSKSHHSNKYVTKLTYDPPKESVWRKAVIQS